MYIDKLWGEYFGDSDDSLVLLDYFKENDETEYTVEQIFRDFNVYNEYSPIEADSFRKSKDIKYVCNGIEHNIDIVIDLILDLSVLILECFHNKKIYLKDLNDNTDKYISIHTNKDGIKMFINILKDFSSNPLKYDLADMCDNETMFDIANKTKYIIDEMSKFIN